MIVVNVGKSFPDWSKSFAGSMPTDLHTVKVADLRGLGDVCAGDWWQVSDMNVALYGDLLVGCYAGQVVAVYHIAGHRQDPATGRVRFQLKPAYDYAALIGAGQPEGPWRKGEGRGYRYVELGDYAERYKGKPDPRRWKYNVAELVMLLSGQLSRDPTPPQQVTHPAEVTFKWPHLGEVTLSWTTTGILEIALPEGIRTRTVRTPAPKPLVRRRGAAKKTTTTSAPAAAATAEPGTDRQPVKPRQRRSATPKVAE